MKAIHIAIKDLSQSFRSMVAVGFMFVVPLLITGLIYFAFSGMAGSEGTTSGALPDFTVTVVNHDQPVENAPQLGAMLVEFLRDERMPAWLRVDEEADKAAALARVDRQLSGAVLIIPADYSWAVTTPGGSAELRIVHDPTLTLGPQVLSSLLRQFADGISGSRVLVQVAQDQKAALGQKLEADEILQLTGAYSAWYTGVERNINHAADPVIRFSSPGEEEAQSANPLSDMFGKTMAGMLVFFVFFTGANMAQTILKEDEEGTLARLFTTPTHRIQILSGKFLAILLMILVQSAVLLVASALAFGIEWGEPFGLAIVAAGLALASTGFGVFLISLLKTTRQAGVVIGATLSLTGMLGGMFTSGIQNMPAGFETVNLFTPHGWALRGFKLMLAGGTAAEGVLPALVLAAIGLVCFAAGLTVFRRRFA